MRWPFFLRWQTGTHAWLLRQPRHPQLDLLTDAVRVHLCVLTQLTQTSSSWLAYSFLFSLQSPLRSWPPSHLGSSSESPRLRRRQHPLAHRRRRQDWLLWHRLQIRLLPCLPTTRKRLESVRADLSPSALRHSRLTRVWPCSPGGHAHHGWLKTFHHFPFASYYDPSNRFQDFGALRVINEDRVIPSEGFGTHGHAEVRPCPCSVA